MRLARWASRVRSNARPLGRSGLSTCPWTAIPLFKLSELEAAFALLLPPATAAECASGWFAQFAGDDVDKDGYFLYEDRHRAAGVDDGEPDVLAVREETVTDAERAASEERLWAGSVSRGQGRLAHALSDLHFALVALVSDEAAERLRVAAALTPAQAARGREQMRRAVAAVRASQ